MDKVKINSFFLSGQATSILPYLLPAMGYSISDMASFANSNKMTEGDKNK